MKNMYEVRGDVAAIFLNYRGILFETIIDTKDLERANEHKGLWSAWWEKTTNSYYVRGSLRKSDGGYRTIQLHKWLYGDTNLIVDHKNHDTLDNRRSCNLREVTAGFNQQNRKGAQINSLSGIRGVSWHKQHNKWRAAVRVDKKDIHLGYFENLEDAEKAVIEGRNKYHLYCQDVLMAGSLRGDF